MTMLMMISGQRSFTFAILILAVGVTVVMCGVAPIQKRSILGDSDGSDLKLRPNKRTFCNAFTGCAGKRSDPMVSSNNKPDYEYDQQTGEGSEDSIDDVIRDILAEARLYEALQRGPTRMSQQGRQQVGFFPRQKRSVAEPRAIQGKDSIKMTSKVQRH